LSHVLEFFSDPNRHTFGRPLGMKSFTFSWPMFLLIAWGFQLGNILTTYRLVPDDYLYGDSTYYAAATDSLLRDGDLDLLNQFHPDAQSVQDVLPKLEGTFSREYGWAQNGYLTLKQSPVFSAAALPMYALFGRMGCLYFNLLTLNLMLIGMVKLAGDSSASRLAVLVGFISTPLWRYSFNFSPDIFLCTLMIGSVWAARFGRVGISGLLAGLAVSTKIYVGVLLLPLPLIVWLTSPEGRLKSMPSMILGGIVGLLPGLAFNTWLFGAPWITGYERQLHIENGIISLQTHSSMFTVPPLTGLQNLMLHEQFGLLWTTPLWFLWPVAAIVAFRKKPVHDRGWILGASLIILANIAVFAPFEGWTGTRIGSRYLFPATVFGFTLIAAAADSLIRKLDKKLSESGKPCAI
jgi:hypothetical protein